MLYWLMAVTVLNGLKLADLELKARIGKDLENAEDGYEYSVNWSYAGQVSTLPFPQGVHDSRTGGLVSGLKEEVQAQLIDASNGCSRVDHFVSANGIKNTVLKSGERIAESYAIAGVGDNLKGKCPEPGEYRMEHDIGDSGTWGFTFQLE